MKHTQRFLGRFEALVWLSSVFLTLAMGGTVVARVQSDSALTLAPAPTDRSAIDGVGPALDPRFFDLILRTLEGTRLELLAVEPGMAPDALRGRLLVDALWLINNVTEKGLGDDQLLSLPRPLREDASRLVSLVLGDPPAPPDPRPGAEGNDESLEREKAIPVRIRPYESLLESFLEAQWREHRDSGTVEPASALESVALDALARAICPSNDPRELSTEERSFAVSLARRIVSGAQGEPSEPDLVDELDALAELLRRENAELKLSEGMLDLEARTFRLEQFGLERLGASIRDRDPSGTIPEGARHRVETLARLIARGVPVSPDPETPKPPNGPRPDESGEGSGVGIDPMAIILVAEWARLVDLGLIVSGVDLANRRETLRRFSVDQLSCELWRRGAPIPAEVISEADRLVDRILAERSGSFPPPTTPVSVPVPMLIGPTRPTTPSMTPVDLLVPAPRHRWLRPWTW